MIQYNNIEHTEYIQNSVLNSKYISDVNSSQIFVDKVGVISIGLKLELAMNIL